MFPVLRPILNRGGAGYSISRDETVEHLQPHIERGLALMRTYDATVPALGAEDAARLDALMPYLRTEVGKLYESVFSAGGTAPTGVGAVAPATGSDVDPLDALLRREREFGKELLAEVDSVHHQERTRAILRAVAAGSTGRLDVLREFAARRPARREQ